MATGFGIAALGSELYILTNQASSNYVIKVESLPSPHFLQYHSFP
jgi:hypothetical protein